MQYAGSVDLSCNEGTLLLLAANVCMLLMTVCTIPDRWVGHSSVLLTADLDDVFVSLLWPRTAVDTNSRMLCTS